MGRRPDRSSHSPLTRLLPVPMAQWRRLSEIVTILWSSGFESAVSAMGLRWCVSLRCRLLCASGLRTCSHQVARRGSRAERMVALLERLGPTYVKLGQMLASRTDYLPAPYAEALRDLHSRVTPFTGERAREIVETELGDRVSEVFAEFDDVPFAAASLSQVHRARLPDGTQVAVKVQRPDARRQVEADLELLDWVARRTQRRLGTSVGFRPTAVVEEFAKYTRRELDFRIEAGVAERVASGFGPDERVVVPRVHRELSGACVLTTDLVTGLPPLPRRELAAAGLDADRLLQVGALAMLKQIFELGTFHADPHPGNLLLLQGDRVCFLDFGLHGRLDRRERRRMGMLLYALGRGDLEAVADQLLHVSWRSPDARIREFKEAAGDLAGAWYSRDAGEMSVGRLLLAYLGVGARFGVEFPRDLLLLARSLVHLETTVKVIDPDLTFSQLLAPLLEEVRHTLMPTQAEAQAVVGENWMDYLALLAELPEDLPHLSEVWDRHRSPGSGAPARRATPLPLLGAVAGGVAAGALSSRLWKSVRTGATPSDR